MENKSTGVVWGCGTLIGIVVIAFIAILFSGAQVNAGNVGVVSNFGAVDQNQQVLPQGFHLVTPFTTHIESVSIQPQNHTFKEVSAASKELQNVYVDGGVNYHVTPEAAAKLVISGGVSYIVGVVFDPAFQDYIKTVIPTYSTEDILPHRDDIRNAVKDKLASKASAYGLTVDDVFLTNIHFDKDYTAAIEAKQVAQQQLEQAKIQAQTAIAAAEGQAKANAILDASLTDKLIRWAEIQKWNGILPSTVGVGGVFVIGGSPVGK